MPIYIAETSYPAEGSIQPETGYPATPRGQLDYFTAVRGAMASALPDGQNGGVLWWQGKEKDWTSIFTDDLVPRPVLRQGFNRTTVVGTYF
jgi:hypothetical protein